MRFMRFYNIDVQLCLFVLYNFVVFYLEELHAVFAGAIRPYDRSQLTLQNFSTRYHSSLGQSKTSNPFPYTGDSFSSLFFFFSGD